MTFQHCRDKENILKACRVKKKVFQDSKKAFNKFVRNHNFKLVLLIKLSFTCENNKNNKIKIFQIKKYSRLILHTILCLNVIIILSLTLQMIMTGVWGRIWVEGLGRRLIAKFLSYSEERYRWSLFIYWSKIFIC